MRIKRQYQRNQRPISEAIEIAKQRLIALSHRLKRYDTRNEQFLINRQFINNPQKVYKEFRIEKSQEERVPNMRQ